MAASSPKRLKKESDPSTRFVEVLDEWKTVGTLVTTTLNVNIPAKMKEMDTDSFTVAWLELGMKLCVSRDVAINHLKLGALPPGAMMVDIGMQLVFALAHDGFVLETAFEGGLKLMCSKRRTLPSGIKRVGYVVCIYENPHVLACTHVYCLYIIVYITERRCRHHPTT